MTTKQIQERKDRETVKYDLAAKIRELFDAARKEYGAQEWDDNGIESEVIELVTEEG